MKIEIDRYEYYHWSQQQIHNYLRSQGMDTTKEIRQKEIRQYEDPRRHCNMIFIGESLPDKVVNYIKTVIGLVPQTIPWEAANA